MNIYVQYIAAFVGFVTSLAALAGGIGYLKSSFSKKEKEERTDVISSADQLAGFWKEQVEGFRDVIKELTFKLEKQKDDHTLEMKKVLTELGEVRGQLNAETKQKAEYLAILQNRDPDTKQFMEFMVQAVKDQSTVNTHVLKAIADQGIINKQTVEVLQEIHAMQKVEHDRDFKVEATVTKTP